MQDFIPIFAIFAVFGSITAIVFGPSFLKYREKKDMQQTIRVALDKGQALPPELIDAITKDVQKGLPSRNKDIRQGIIWLATGVGMAAFGAVTNSLERGWDNDFGSFVLGVACIPAVIGVAFIILSFFNPNKD